MNEKIMGQAKKLAVRIEVAALLALLGAVALACVICAGFKGFYRGVTAKTDADFIDTAKLGWEVFKKGSRA